MCLLACCKRSKPVRTLSVSTLVLGVVAAAATVGLAVEGARSLLLKYDIEARITALEQSNSELREAVNHILTGQTAQNTMLTVGSSAIQIEQTSRTVDHEDLDIFCLAKNIFHEAGVEDELGMFAVAQVTLNRVRNSSYPDTVCDVVMQPSQFSWTNDRSRRWTHPSGPKWNTAKRIARQVIKEGYRVPALQSAMFYHADYMSPEWRDPNSVVAQVGTHIFYTAAR